MIKKLKLSLLIVLFLTTFSFASTGIYIFATVDNEIITNHDVEKESEYLKILNPNLQQLSYDQVLDLALNSLIREIVKKKEITKFADLNKDNPLVNDQLKRLFIKLNYNNEREFEQNLLKKNNYSLDQIKQKIKIELIWNELIYKKYNKQVAIDKKKLIKRVDSLSGKTQKKFFLSEILFEKKKDQNFEAMINQITLSINEIGFDNTANIYSISDSANLGGKIGWVDENSLSELILEKLKLIKTGEYTEIIKISNNYLILKIDQIELNEIKIDKQQELKKLIQFETNKQLNQFSRIYFSKSKINYFINEN